MKFDRYLHLLEKGRTGANVGGEGSLHFMQPKIQQGQLQDHFVHDSKFIKIFPNTKFNPRNFFQEWHVVGHFLSPSYHPYTLCL